MNGSSISSMYHPVLQSDVMLMRCVIQASCQDWSNTCGFHHEIVKFWYLSQIINPSPHLVDLKFSRGGIEFQVDIRKKSPLKDVMFWAEVTCITLCERYQSGDFLPKTQQILGQILDLSIPNQELLGACPCLTIMFFDFQVEDEACPSQQTSCKFILCICGIWLYDITFCGLY